jgi:exodeoxyribonuclease-5
MKMLNWSKQQIEGLDLIEKWFNDPDKKQVFRLFGYAGTGKSTLALEISKRVDGKTVFAAFTGKAAHVMKSKGCSDASTIHSLIYKLEEEPKDNEDLKFVLSMDSPIRFAKLVIIDEVSMVDETLGNDLLSFGVPVLVLGDPAQLPPVSGTGYFTNHKPDYMLTEIHRQAEDSPIIILANAVRLGQTLEYGEYGESRVIHRSELGRDDILKADQIIVGKNNTRHSFNNRIRQMKGITSEYPIIGEKLICLRNNKKKKILNGSLWNVIQDRNFKKANMGPFKDKITMLRVLSEDEGYPVNISVRNEFWRGDEEKLKWEDKKYCDDFTYGYALTCHKSQGSQWDNVTLFDESAVFRDDARRHLYTAITRAAKRITIVK